MKIMSAFRPIEAERFNTKTEGTDIVRNVGVGLSAYERARKQVLIFNTLCTFGWSKNTDDRMASIDCDFPDRDTVDFRNNQKFRFFIKNKKL